MVKIGDFIKFNMDSDDEDLNDFLYDNDLFYKNLKVVNIDKNSGFNGQLFVENIPFAIDFNDNFLIV